MSRGYYVPCAPFLYFVPDSGGPQQQQHATAGAGAAMDVQLRPPPPPAASTAPFQYLIHEQAKSLVALQELQNEVGALLEFRELVMETFPHLRNKMCSSSPSTETASATNEACSSTPVTPCSTSTVPPPRWGPGVRVRRKIHPKERGGNSSSGDIDDSSAESSKQAASTKSQPKSSEGATSGSTVQDSGFSTETKEHHSSSSVLSPKLTAALDAGELDASMDELWNLLDVIQRKGSRLRDEVEELHTKLQHDANKAAVRGGGGEGHAHVDADAEEWGGAGPAGVRSWGDEDDDDMEVQRLRHERDVLLDKLTEMEAETLQSRVRVSQLQAELRQVSSIRKDLEDQLHAAVTQKSELNNRIHDLHNQFIRRLGHSISTPSSINDAPKAAAKKAFSTQVVRGSRAHTPDTARGFSSPPGPPSSQFGFGSPLRASCFQPVIRSSSSPSPRREPRHASSLDSEGDTKASPVRLHASGTTDSRIPRPVAGPESSRVGAAGRPLGALDGLLSEPAQAKRALGPSRRPDPRKVAAILREHNTLELQRHLLTTVVLNEALHLRLETASRSKGDLSGELERVREENDELRFQLEEKSIELEGTRARVRVLERHQLAVGTPCLARRQLLPGTDPDPPLNSSSTESAHDLASPPLPLSDKPPEAPKRHNNRNAAMATIKAKKPSRIPLPPPKSFSAPNKPVVNKNSSSLGRTNLKKNNNDSSPLNNSLQNNLKSTSRDSISTKSKDSLNKSRESLLVNKSSLPRKTPTLPRPSSSPSAKPNNCTLIKTGTLELDTTKDSLNSSGLPMVEVALESYPADSLNIEFKQQPLQESLEDIMPWQSSPSEYFDSINSERQRAEELWQRHSDITQPRTHAETLVSSVEEVQSSSASSFPYKPQDSLDTSAKNVNENCWHSKWSSEETSDRGATVGLWRVSQHIETILRQISQQTGCDHNN